MKSVLARVESTSSENRMLVILRKYDYLIDSGKVSSVDHKYCFNLLGEYLNSIIASSLNDEVIMLSEQIFTKLYNLSFNRNQQLALSEDLHDRFEEILSLVNSISYTISKKKRRNSLFFKDLKQLGRQLVELSSLTTVSSIISQTSLLIIEYMKN
ncbi:MAG: hypothetical protein AAF741_11535 [Bacteroidota bacterium]